MAVIQPRFETAPVFVNVKLVASTSAWTAIFQNKVDSESASTWTSCLIEFHAGSITGGVQVDTVPGTAAATK